MKNTAKTFFYNALFIAVCLGIFLILYRAPPETTSFYPKDNDHLPYWNMKKKEAEKHCAQCHSEHGIAPLSENHPPPYRCLFCHKRV